jgi:hypothetical protein
MRPPPRLVRHVDHRAVDLLDADRRGLARGDRVVGCRDRRVEAARLPERDREHGPVAVDRVEREQDRNVQPRLLDGNVLQVVDPGGVREAEHAADAGAGTVVGDLPVGVELQLVQLLLQCHLLDEVVDLLLDARVGWAAGALQCDGIRGA